MQQLSQEFKYQTLLANFGRSEMWKTYGKIFIKHSTEHQLSKLYPSNLRISYVKKKKLGLEKKRKREKQATASWVLAQSQLP